MIANHPEVTNQAEVRPANAAIRARIRQMDPAQVKAMLLAHVRRCVNPHCMACAKIRIRVFQSKNPLHGHLLDPDAYGETKRWSSPTESSADDRVRKLLRDGADIHKSVLLPIPLPGRSWQDRRATPLKLAQMHDARGCAPMKSAAWMVLRAADPWRTSTHHLFGIATRKRVLDLLFIGHALSLHFPGEEQAMMDVWLEYIIPKIV